MAHCTAHQVASTIILLAITSSVKPIEDQSRWSRQLSSYTADITDWVPLPGPVEREPEQLPQIKRQAVAEPRILTEPFPALSRPTGFGQDAFASRNYFNSASNRQLYLQSVPSVPTAPQNYLTEQGFGQSIRFGLSQPNFPLTQGFIAPPLTFESAPAPPKPRQPQPLPSNPISFPQSNLPLAPQVKPFINQVPKIKPETPKFIDGYRAENTSDFTFAKKKPQSLQKFKFENADKLPRTETIPNPKVEREEVQLLYVPLESLNRGQFNFKSPLTSAQLLNTELYSQGIPKQNPPKQTFISDYQRPAAKPVDNYSGQNYFADFNSQFRDTDQVPKFSTITSPFPTQAPTSPKPKKLKPHQPPLAIFMTRETAKANQIKVGDVLSSLKSADTIAVLDSVNPLNAPKVFIGPSSLPPPENFVKFELPYLSNIENSEKKLKQLPFFVAPLSYNTPQGFAKIPFPSPHVGSVVINAQIKDTTQAPPLQANVYTAPPTRKPEYKPTQKPQFSFFSTATPNTKPVTNYQSNYYSFEPQHVSSIGLQKQPEVVTPPSKTGSYFLTNVGPQYNSNEYVNFPQQDTFKSSEIEAIQSGNYIPRRPATTSTTTTTTSTTTTKPPSTYPSQLLETHNPYSINQAFHFSTPLDYHNYFEDIKQPHGTPSVEKTPPPPPPTPANPQTPAPKPEEAMTEKPKYQQKSPPVYLQNYTPEIHYDNKGQSWRYPVFNPNDYTEKTEQMPPQIQPTDPVNTDPTISTHNTEYNQNDETQTSIEQETPKEIKLPSAPEINSQPKYEDYNQYENNDGPVENPTTPTSTTTTTTSRRTPIRHRGRPRYTTARPESYEYSTRTVVTRKPLRERRPLPTRPRYEPNKITTEKPNKIPSESSESTTKSNRGRTRGRIHYRPTENEDLYDRRIKSHNGKEADLAYQRDVLHQNYPVTLMERTSTVDIEAITEPTLKISSTNPQDSITETSDTENAYTNERVLISQQASDTEYKEDQPIPTFTSRTTLQSETSYVPKLPSTRNEEYFYQSRSTVAPTEQSSYQDGSDQEEDIFVKPTDQEQKLDKAESNSYVTEPIAIPVTEQSLPNYSVNNDYSTTKQEETTTSPEAEPAKTASQENNEDEVEEEENVVQTTPSYNRVRVRPGVIRQYHQASTESSRKQEKRRQQSVTYRPAFDRRRTTMRIEEIEADLKTKKVHSRPEFHEHKHPVYKPEPTTEPAVTSNTESATKRGHFRRRRPSYSHTTSTESSSSTRRTYDVKNRFRGRRPTEKPTEKPDASTEVSTSTIKNSLHSRYSHRPKLSERYNKKPDPEPEVEDQDPNFSINRPKFAQPDTEQWSPKITIDSFKPYNPNNIVEDLKIATTERRSDKESELDIITAKNEYDDILISVTPATNNRMTKKIPEIPPTLEALVEQSKVTKTDSSDSMSTFESMLEEVMKSLEEQDQDEYTSNVMKHKGGEIGEIPPERIISSGENYIQKSTTVVEPEITTVEPVVEDSSAPSQDEHDPKSRRRGFWKKVKVRPATTESIEFAESQYYTNTVNRLGHPVKPSKTGHEKTEKTDKLKVTTYKPSFEFIKNLFENEDNLPNLDGLPTMDIQKVNHNKDEEETLIQEESQQTTVYVAKETQTAQTLSPGDLDLGTGSPDPTLDDLYSTTEVTTSKTTIADRSDGYSFMDYLFGMTSEDSEKLNDNKNKTVTKTTEADVEITTEPPKPKVVTTETTFVPDEITAVGFNDETTENIPEFSDVKKTSTENENEKPDESTEISVVKVETSSMSSYMNPVNVLSTSMSTEISHETEICFRGKCIKTSRDIL